VNGLVDWELAERAAAITLAGLPGRRAEEAPEPYGRAEVERACAEAIETVAAYAALGAVDRPPAPELIDRRAWVHNALAALAEAAAPVEARVAEDLSLPGPLGALARRAAGAALGAEAGLAAGYAGRRVLGQYDVAILGEPRPARLLFVGENLAAARVELEADRELFLRWIALHECAHVVQFDRVGWLRDHLRALVTELLEGAAQGVDLAALGAAARRLLRDPRASAQALLRGELVRTLADPDRRRLLDRLQATMSVIEGHAEHVMDACAGEHGAGLAELRRRLALRRARRGGLGELIARLFGMDLKLRQYEQGKRFCDRVVAEAGAGAMILLWRTPEDLPDPAELEAPERWLERVAAVPA
jgi:coenzyme F420 biosynthesis associated uncharacterized protein